MEMWMGAKWKKVEDENSFLRKKLRNMAQSNVGLFLKNILFYKIYVNRQGFGIIEI